MRRTLSKPDAYQILAGRQGNHQQRDRLLVAMAVRMARAALGWSQSELGQFLGMSQRAIHRIEQGHSEPRRTTLLAIETLLSKAGLKIEDRSDGGFSLIVPESMLGDAAGTMDVAAPSLVNFSLVSDESEALEPVRQ
jgi:transcriptional regulator with XRE-family HTH domain